MSISKILKLVGFACAAFAMAAAPAIAAPKVRLGYGTQIIDAALAGPALLQNFAVQGNEAVRRSASTKAK